MSCALTLDAATVVRDGRTVVDRVSLRLEAGQIGCLLGPSGSGKTTLLRCVAGLQQLDTGRVRLGQQWVSGNHVHVPPEKRKIGMVFQDHALFPHLSVAQNIVFGIRKLPAARREERLETMLELIGLTGLRGRYPHELSGGQQQRVALARTLAPEPRLLLLDEPFSNIDAGFRLQLAEDVRALILEQKTTALLITHSQEEALATADVLGVIDRGKLLQWDKTYDVYHRPASKKVATFIGMGNMLKGRIRGADQVETALGRFTVGAHAYRDGARVEVLIRPDDVIHDDHSDTCAVIEKKQFQGPQFLYQLRLNSGEAVYCLAPSHHDHRIGAAIGIKMDVEHVVIFDVTGED